MSHVNMSEDNSRTIVELEGYAEKMSANEFQTVFILGNFQFIA